MEKERDGAREGREREEGPPPSSKRPVARSSEGPEHFSQLEALGIEFESSPAKAPSQTTKPPIQTIEPRAFSEEKEVVKNVPLALSLSEALGKEPVYFSKSKKRKEVDLNALREALRDPKVSLPNEEGVKAANGVKEEGANDTGELRDDPEDLGIGSETTGGAEDDSMDKKQ
jgi:hypothetical protein